MKTKAEGRQEYTNTMNNALREVEDEKEDILKFKRKQRTRVTGFERKREM